jgi:HK97 family phage prohead protease
MKTVIERRLLKFDRIEIRAAEGGGKLLAGHAAVFDKDSEEMWGFTERVAAGAFTKTLQEDDIRGLFNHNPDYVLGRNTSKTLRLAEDAVGLGFEIDLPDTQLARDLVISIERGDITGCSFGFSTISDKWDYSEDGSRTMRTLLECKLYDVGPVTFPAYPDTDVAVRSVMEQIAKEGRQKLEAQRSGAAVPLDVRRRQLALVDV